ncbi:proton-conducting transporter membrane subunit [Serratia sp. NPDC078593]|uniref:proton-conducting transporter transmembrane domain-containing protein n=1 Tax=unclassified Serratia (in: enterobacteria) TaxID=2647522 RepID=UPI0037D4DCF5
MIIAFLPDPLLLLTLSLCGSLLLAALCWLLAIWPRLCARVCACGSVLVSLAASAAALPWLFSPPHHANLPGLLYAVEISGLNALLLLTLSLSNLFVSLYLCPWLATLKTRSRARQGSLILLLPATLNAAVMADNALAMVLLLELAALCSYFLIAGRHDAKNQQASHSHYVLMRLGTLLLVAAFALIYSQIHSLQFSAMRTTVLPAALRDGVFLLALAGFGIYAGIMPLHGWVPQAHSSAPAPAASLLSCALMKVGLLGVIKIGMDVLGAPPLWWGLLVLLLAAVTALFGGLYALMEHDLRRLLAYHTLENIGIILLGIGGAMVGLTLQLPTLTTLALVGGLFHLFNHSLFKSALMLSAGVIEQQTGLKDIEKMGGLARQMPWTAIALLIGLVSMAALPPLNGFASEWLIYQGLFQFSAAPAFLGRLLGPLLAVVLAITGALAVMCVSKVFGVACLGAPRSEAAATARPARLSPTLSHGLPALLCLLCGIGAPWLIPVFAKLAASFTPNAPLPTPLVSPPLFAILLLAMPLLPLLIASVYHGKRLATRSAGSAWACGYNYEASMAITASGFAQPLRVMFAPLFALRKTWQPEVLQRALHRAPITTFCRRIAAIELAVLLIVALA